MPAVRADTTPAFVTVATAELLLIHVPPAVGLSVIEPMRHKLVNGALTIGLALIVTEGVELLQPVEVCAYVNVAVPAASADTTPAFVTVAAVGLLLIHIPPVVGLRAIEPLIHKPVNGALTMGFALITTDGVEVLQPVAVCV